MKKNRILKKSFMVAVITVFSLLASTTVVSQGPDQQLATITVTAGEIVWQPQVEGAGFGLTISGPGGFHWQQTFQPGERIAFGLPDGKENVLPDGVYQYELTTLPTDQPAEPDAAERGLTPEATGTSQWGSFSVLYGSFVLQKTVVGTDQDPGKYSLLDQVILDDLIVDGSLCVGFDCANGESFGFDTIRLKENNLRIKFEDTSASASFPTNDWQITINDSSNGGQNKFSIDDIDGGRTPFTIEAGAPSHSLYVDDYGRVGLGTSSPSVEVHVKDSDTPTVRLEQDGSGGWTPQTWDMAGNESNFFIRDVTNGSQLSFRIQPGAPSNSLTIKSDGKVGLGTWAPDADLHVKNESGETLVNVEGQGPRFRLTDRGGTNGDVYWDVFVHNTWNRLMIQVDGGNIPVKIDDGAANNLLRLGIGASDEVAVNGDLVVSGQCTEADGACAPDYVFEPQYGLLSLAELEAYIAEHKHLPNVPSGAELDANGVNVQDFTYVLLEKIEELTLYVLQQEQTIKNLETRLATLEGAK